MGQGAVMTLTNSLSSELRCQVSDVSCMYQNGDENSRLDAFNATLAPHASLSGVYIEANGNVFDACAGVQSQFVLSFSTADGVIGGVRLALGGGAYVTSVLANSSPQMIDVAISPSGDQFAIDVVVSPVSLIAQLANSLIAANAAAIEAELCLPPTNVPGFRFGDARITGIGNLTCAAATVTTSASGAIQFGVALTASQLGASCTIDISGLPDLAPGLTLENPRLAVNADVVIVKKATSVHVTSFQLSGGVIRLAGTGLEVPELLGAVETIVNSPPTQALIINTINSYLPH